MPPAVFQILVQVGVLDILRFLLQIPPSNALQFPDVEGSAVLRGPTGGAVAGGLGVLVYADVGDGGGKAVDAEARVGGEGVGVGYRELALLPLAEQQVVERCVIIVQPVLHRLGKWENW